MESIPMTDVQLANLSMLLTIKDSIQQDRAAACCKFGLRADELETFSTLSTDRILAIVANMGQESMFPPRNDLGQLLRVPLPLSGVMAAARPLRRPHDAALSAHR